MELEEDGSGGGKAGKMGLLHAKGSGKIARYILQQIEEMGLAEQETAQTADAARRIRQ